MVTLAVFILSLLSISSSCCRSRQCGQERCETTPPKNENHPQKQKRAANVAATAPSDGDSQLVRDTATPSAKKPLPRAGYSIPAFSIPKLNGGTCTNKDYAGKVSIVEVWSYRCPHCVDQAKELEKLAKTLDFKKHALVSIHAMGGRGVSKEVKKHFSDKRITVCLDNASLLKKLRALPTKYHVRGIPHLMLVDSKGVIKKVLRGTRTAAQLKAILK